MTHEKLQFRVLYRQFLFRMVDLELLSAAAQGDIHRLLGRFAALLIFLSLWFGGSVLVAGSLPLPPPLRLIATWAMEHFLVATTMLVVGLFAVISWDSMFPDRRDVLVLSPLPIRAKTLFLAKAAAVATALSLAVGTLNAFSSLASPIGFVSTGSALALLRMFGAYWITMLAAGVFNFCLVLSIQGLAQLLPRQQFLRVSAILQIAAFFLFVSVFFLQLPFASPSDLLSLQSRRLLAWLPSYWFFGLFQQLNGVSTPEAFTMLARRAWIGLAGSLGGAGAAYLICYFRTLRKIAEQPDILPGSAGLRWLPRFGECAHDSGGAVQHPHSVAQPVAPRHAFVLSGDCVRACAFHVQGPGSLWAAGADGRSLAPSQSPDAGGKRPGDVLRSGGNAGGLPDAN